MPRLLCTAHFKNKQLVGCGGAHRQGACGATPAYPPPPLPPLMISSLIRGRQHQQLANPLLHRDLAPQAHLMCTTTCHPGRCDRFQGVLRRTCMACCPLSRAKQGGPQWLGFAQPPPRHAWIHPTPTHPPTYQPTHPGDLSPTCAVMARALLCLTGVKSTTTTTTTPRRAPRSKCGCAADLLAPGRQQRRRLCQ